MCQQFYTILHYLTLLLVLDLVWSCENADFQSQLSDWLVIYLKLWQDIDKDRREKTTAGEMLLKEDRKLTLVWLLQWHQVPKFPRTLI